MSDDLYIWIRNWDRFQHYKNRRPPWIKFYTQLLNDDAYLSLTPHRALLLHRLWLAFASADRQLLLNTSSLSRHTFLKVTMSDIESLNHAGFIDIVASKTLAALLAGCLQDARPEKEKEIEEEPSFLPSVANYDANLDFDGRTDGNIETLDLQNLLREIP